MTSHIQAGASSASSLTLVPLAPKKLLPTDICRESGPILAQDVKEVENIFLALWDTQFFSHEENQRIADIVPKFIELNEPKFSSYTSQTNLQVTYISSRYVLIILYEQHDIDRLKVHGSPNYDQNNIEKLEKDGCLYFKTKWGQDYRYHFGLSRKFLDVYKAADITIQSKSPLLLKVLHEMQRAVLDQG